MESKNVTNPKVLHALNWYLLTQNLINHTLFFFLKRDRLGLFDVNEPFDPQARSVMDAFCSLLQKKLQYAPKEHDLVYLHHQFDIDEQTLTRTHTSTLCLIGDDRHSAMSRTVGLPAAIGTKLLLFNDSVSICPPGVHAPLQKSLYKLILEELASDHGIAFNTNVLNKQS